LKDGDKNTTVALILGSAMFSLIVYFGVLQDTYAVNNISAVAGLPEALELGSPFYIEDYQEIVGKPEILNNRTSGSYTGEGILNGNLSVTSAGNATETFRNNETVFIQGNAKFVTNSGDDSAFYNFQAIGNYNLDGSFEDRGAAFFDNNATGKLSFLNNAVAIYKDLVGIDGNGTFLMWHWK
jgi:hypothetical protein